MSSENSKKTYSLKTIIPDSNLAALGDFYVCDPIFYEGDNVYELDIPTVKEIADQQIDDTLQSNEESWMLPETERAFLRYIVGDREIVDIQNAIDDIKQDHYHDKKKLFLKLDSNKTNILTENTLYYSKSENKTKQLAPKNVKTSKKTDFTLKEWPYVSFNQPLVTSGCEDELPPWVRLRKKQYHFSNFPKFEEKLKPATRTSSVEPQVQNHSEWVQTPNFLYPVPQFRQILTMTEPTMTGLMLVAPRQINRQPIFSYQHHYVYPQYYTAQSPLHDFYHRYPSPALQVQPIQSSISPLLTPPPFLVQNNHSMNQQNQWKLSPTNCNKYLASTNENDITSYVCDQLKYNKVLQNIPLLNSDQFVIDDFGDSEPPTTLHKNVKKLKDSLVNPQSKDMLAGMFSILDTNSVEVFSKIISIIGTEYPRRLEQFNKIKSTVDYLNSQLPIAVD